MSNRFRKLNNTELNQIAADMERWWDMTHLSPSHATRLEALFDTALDLDAAQRIEFLDTVPAEFRKELDELLKTSTVDSFLDQVPTDSVALAAQSDSR